MIFTIIFSLSVLLYITVLILGFIIGRMTLNKDDVLNSSLLQIKNSPLKTKQQIKKVISIDEKKIVTNIKTESLIKNGEIGVLSIINDDVGTSVSKLTQFKKNK